MSNRPQSISWSNPEQTPKQKARRWITSLLLTPIFIIGLFALALAYRIHAGNKAVISTPLPDAHSPLINSSILIFSPHPDDETLGTGGLIQQTLAAGGKVHVVFMTNGDAFRVGVADYYKILSVHPSDYIRYGEMRQGEALRALATLGLPSRDVTFLGYPDRGLMGMWENNWQPSNPYQSGYSKTSINPYPNAPTYGQPYCGQNVLDDVERQITLDRPTDIFVTHPSDDHPDHSAASSFIFTAVHSLEASGETWAGRIRIHYFLIHRGDWPVPQGLYTYQMYAPPAAFIGLDTQWSSLWLTKKQTTIKKRSLDNYVSQEEMMSRFLVSFIRRNEIFGQLPESLEHAEALNENRIHLAANGAAWPQSKPVAQDPVGDTVLRDFQPGGDISGIYAAIDSTNLYVRVSTHARLSHSVVYTLSIRPFDDKMNTIPSVITYQIAPAKISANEVENLPNGTTACWNGNAAYYTIPLNSLSISSPKIVFVQATTTFSQVTVDHTGYRPVFLSPPPIPTPLS